MILEQKTSRFLIGTWTALLFCLFVFFRGNVFGEKMPLEHLTTADGLPQNTINCIAQDGKGFFWIGTNGGLARFDGYEFVNFTKDAGLPRNEVQDFLETGADDFWLATRGGLVKFDPAGKKYDRVINPEEAARLAEKPAFITYATTGDSKNSSVTKLLRDARGNIWVGTENGLFKFEENGAAVEFSPVNLDLPADESKYVYFIYQDRSGAVWIGTGHNLTRISAENLTTTYRSADGAIIFSRMLEDAAGSFWVGTQHKGLFQFAIDANQAPQIVRRFADSPDSEIEWIDAIAEADDGKLLVGGSNGLCEFSPADGKLFRYTRTSGLSYYRFRTMFRDRSGNLWLGTLTNGIYRLSTRGLLSFETEDRISFVPSVRLDAGGDLLMTAFVTNTELDEKGALVERDIAGKAALSFEWRLGRAVKNGFSWLVPKFSEPIHYYGWGSNQLSFQSPRSGEWWIVTGGGLFRFPAVAFEDLKNTVPIERFDERRGLKPADVFRIFEDSKGDVWIATSGEESNGFFKWERASGALRDMAAATDGFSAVKFNLISAFAEDGAGNIWLGFSSQGFARISGGQLDFWGDERGVPTGGVTNLLFDRENRLWIATRQGGILRVDRPEAEALEFVNYTETNGLSSNRTLSLAQDKAGFIYVGTDRDISRLNPQTEKFKRLNLAKNQLQREYRSAVCDKNGVLWFGTTEGLVKYVPEPEMAMSPPEILITNVRVEGVAQKISATGTTVLDLPNLAPEQNEVRIDYVSLSNFEDEGIAYQYKFDDGEWSPPSSERFVNFANLSAGDYRIYFRAIATADGATVSEKPAVVTFQILPPVYLRWWFLTFAALGVAAIVYAFYRLKVQRLLEIERTRTLIATDLHDDIGSNLSKISVLSEVVRMQLASEGNSDNKLLGSIAEISRQSVGSMSDIVWAINPARDSAQEMSRKMREHAEEIFVPYEVAVRFNEPEKSAKIKVPMHLRRDFYLIFKEAVNNVSKHSACASVKIDFQIKNNEIVLKIEDDGRGFDPQQQTSGNGLSNMRDRVAKLRGVLEINSSINGGTTLEIRIPQK